MADLEGRLQTADPLFPLIHGFSDKVLKVPVGSHVFQRIIWRPDYVNPRRYGAMTRYDHARAKLSMFTREEDTAIVAYLEYKRDTDFDGFIKDEIASPLEGFWRMRVREVPAHEELRQHVQAEVECMQTIGGDWN